MRVLMRWTVPTPHFSLRAVALMESPDRRLRSIRATLSGSRGGRPDFFELRRNPAMIRSRRIERSNSAKTLNIENIARPAGVEVSRPCVWR